MMNIELIHLPYCLKDAHLLKKKMGPIHETVERWAEKIKMGGKQHVK